MQYKVGDIVTGRINKIKDNGCFCSFLPLYQNQFGFMPNHLMPSFFDENGSFTKSVGDYIEIVINKVTERGIITSDIQTYEKEQNKLKKQEEKAKLKEKTALFASTYEIGTIFEAEVIKVKNSKVEIMLGGDFPGIIRKEDINWNEIERLEDLLFEGEQIQAVFIKSEKGQLYFSLKILDKKPYEESLYSLSLGDLLKYIGHDTNIFIGKAKQYHYGWFIENLYSTSEYQKGKLLIDPVYGYNLRAIVPNTNFFVEEDKYYKVELKLVPQNKRLERNQLFQFTAINIEEYENPYKEDVRLAFQRNTTNPASNQRDAKLLEEIGKNMYSSKERMFFELIQNADDAASQNGVLVNVVTEGDYLIIKHNGYSFDKEDFVSITTAANGTKKANENKTGYKGIGFKSVFTDSAKVFINTGGYQFKFDKGESIFQDFDTFYLQNNPMIINEEAKQRFLNLYSDSKVKFEGIHSIPWQLEPIWVDEFPKELGDDFTRENVGIALELGLYNIIGENGYQQAIEEIIRNPKFMLFLRKTNRIDFNGLSVSKKANNDIIILKNSFNDKRIEYFKRKDFNIEISNETFEKNDINIRINIEERDDCTGKILEAKFVDLHNQELETIPKKIAINNSTVISFAISIGEDGSLLPNRKCSEISLFAYLPTLVKDFKFPFYINANFILDPPRQRILGDNPWNFYLMQEIAKSMVKWSSDLNKKEDRNALNILIPKYFVEDSADTKQLAEHFNRSYKTALETESFILNHKGELAQQKEIIIDKTHLSEVIGCELFCQLMQTNKGLPSDYIDSQILEKEIFEYIEKLSFDFVIEKITNNSQFDIWFINSTEEEKDSLYKWINANNISNQEASIKEFVSHLPLFKYGEEYKSYSELKNLDLLITTKLIQPIKDILVKLGFICSENVFDEDNPLFNYIEEFNELELFNLIRESDFTILTSEERKSLFKALDNFKGIGQERKKSIALFRNMDGNQKPLEEMVAYRNNIPKWLTPYVICQEDYSEDLSSYLVCQEDEFDIIVKKNYQELEVSLSDLYTTYINDWTGQFTRDLIDKQEVTDEILSIIEESDNTTKEYLLKKIDRLDLHSQSNYSNESFEYRVLQIALSVFEEPSTFSSKIYFDGKCIKEFSVSDEVVCEFIQNGATRKVKLSLARLLPHYENQSDSIVKIKSLFENKRDLDKFFIVTSKPLYEIHKELNQHLNIPEANFSKWAVKGNASQYIFATYYRRHKKNWFNSYVPSIDLNNESSEFVRELMDFLYENDINIAESPFTYHLKPYFTRKYFDSDYIFDSEQLLFSIENWADDEKKRLYLIKNGIIAKNCLVVQFRELFLQNQPIDFLESISDIDLKSGIEFISMVDGYERPFKGDNQRTILLTIDGKTNFLSVSRDKENLENNSTEWEREEYKNWKDNHNLQIYILNGFIPSLLLYNNQILLSYEDEKKEYYYDNQNQKLYISDTQNIDDILIQIVKDKDIVFDIDDYRILCLEGKVAISKDEIESQEQKIKTLSEKIVEKDCIIERYKAKYGDIDINDDDNSSGINHQKIESSTVLNRMQSAAQEELYIQEGKVIDRDGISTEKQIAAHTEAERAVRQELESNGYDCSNWIIDETEIDSPFKKWQSYSQIKDVINPTGEKINLVVKSAKGGYIYLSATDFEFLTSDRNNVLMVWDGNRVHSVSSEDIFNKDSNVNLIFDTEYTPKHYYAALSKVFQFVKRTTFAVKNPRYNAFETIKTFGLDSKTEGVAELFDDESL